jgi:hypothetical protein
LQKSLVRAFPCDPSLKISFGIIAIPIRRPV